jgi:hypothetical protein
MEQTIPTAWVKKPNEIEVKAEKVVMATFYHDDNPFRIENGVTGEKRAVSIFKKYALKCDNKVDYYTTLNSKGNGYDFVMVDHAAKYVMILEAKSTFLQKAMASNSLVLTCSTDNPLGDPNFDKVKRYVASAVKRMLQEKIKDQLSRQWCDASKDLGIDMSNSKFTRVHYKNYLECFADLASSGLGYKYFRVASITFGKENDIILPVTTYYCIVEDSDISISAAAAADDFARHGVVNAGMSFDYFWAKNELSTEEAIRYLNERVFCETQSIQFPAKWICVSSPTGRMSTSSPAPENPVALSPRSDLPLNAPSPDVQNPVTLDVQVSSNVEDMDTLSTRNETGVTGDPSTETSKKRRADCMPRLSEQEQRTAIKYLEGYINGDYDEASLRNLFNENVNKAAKYVSREEGYVFDVDSAKIFRNNLKRSLALKEKKQKLDV